MKDIWPVFLIPLLLVFLCVTIVYSNYTDESYSAIWHKKAGKICYEYKPAKSWDITRFECLEVK